MFITEQYIRQIGNFADHTELILRLMERQFSIKDLPVPGQYLTYWHKEGVLPKAIKQTGRWTSMNFFELVYLRLVIKAREVGMDMNSIREMHTHTMTPLNEYIDLMFSKLLDATLGQKLENSPEEQAVVDALEQIIARKLAAGEQVFEPVTATEVFMGKKEKKDKTDEFLSYFTPLSLAILFSVICRERTSVIVPFEGERLFPFIYWHNSAEAYAEFPIVEQVLNGTHVQLSISEIVKEFIEDRDFEFLQTNVPLLNADEAEVLRLLKTDELVELKVRLSEGKVTLIEATQQVGGINPQKKLVDIITSRGYQEISFTTQHGKVVNFRNTVKHKPGK